MNCPSLAMVADTEADSAAGMVEGMATDMDITIIVSRRLTLENLMVF